MYEADLEKMSVELGAIEEYKKRKADYDARAAELDAITAQRDEVGAQCLACCPGNNKVQEAVPLTVLRKHLLSTHELLLHSTQAQNHLVVATR